MRELKRMFVAALCLTFLGGLGAGVFLGGLRAATPAPSGPLDRRVQDWQGAFELTPSQVRRLREILARYDLGVQQLRDAIGAEQYRRIEELRERHRVQIRSDVLTPEQRVEYDRRRGGG